MADDWGRYLEIRAELGDLRATATQIPGARLAVLPGCGHLETFTRCDLALPIVLPFLTETLIETPA